MAKHSAATLDTVSRKEKQEVSTSDDSKTLHPNELIYG